MEQCKRKRESVSFLFVVFSFHFILFGLLGLACSTFYIATTLAVRRFNDFAAAQAIK